MTVCIGVIPRFTDKIILVSDLLLSSEEASVEGVMKWATIAPGTEWYAMFAGDPSRFPTLMDRVREVLGDVGNTRLTLGTATAAFESAYRLELLKLIEVLVAGLDGTGQTQLFSVSSRGLVAPAALPYHAIGAGTPVALGTLYPLTYFPTPMPDLTETVYRVCAAKFAAETVPSVGKSTHAMIISPMAGTWTLLMEIDRLRELWLTKGQPPVPPGALRMIKRDLKRLEFTSRRRRRGKSRAG